MAGLFSSEWMTSLTKRWNGEPTLSDALAEVGFDTVPAYGCDGEEQPQGVTRVENGKVVSAGSYAGETLDWDLRATEEQWKRWMAKPLDMTALGVAYTSCKLEFEVGDCAVVINDPRMAGPCIENFVVTGRA